MLRGKKIPYCRSNKGLFIGARLTLYNICWQLFGDRLQGIKQAEKNMRDQRGFCSAGLAPLMELNNPKDKDQHLLSSHINPNSAVELKG